MIRRFVLEKQERWGWIRGVSRVICLSILFSGGVGQSVFAGEATEAMRVTIDEVLKLVQDKELKQVGRHAERLQRLQQVIQARFNYQEMSRRALGAVWNTLSDQAKEEFVSLFQQLLTDTYADKVELYADERVQYISERTDKEYAEVRTKVRTGKVEIPLDYRMLKKNEEWQVYDVIIDGVSLVSNYRGQFSKILRSSTYADLVDQLRKKSDKIKTP